MSIIPSDSHGRPNPFAEFDRPFQQIMDHFFSHDPFSFPDHSFFSWASPFRTAGFPFFAGGGPVDEDGFVTVTMPKQELALVPEKRRPDVRVVEIEEKN